MFNDEDYVLVPCGILYIFWGYFFFSCSISVSFFFFRDDKTPSFIQHKLLLQYSFYIVGYKLYDCARYIVKAHKFFFSSHPMCYLVHFSWIILEPPTTDTFCQILYVLYKYVAIGVGCKLPLIILIRLTLYLQQIFFSFLDG